MNGMLVLLIAFLAGETISWSIDVDGLQRSANIYVPSNASKPKADAPKLPVVFAFHGHGGNARQAQRSFQIERHWPEAFVVYMQGVPTPGQLTDPEGKKNGWQKEVGDQRDRDLKFFDAILKKLETEYAIDENRVYATGHSNGGGFTYLLWSARGNKIAAFAPSASAAGRRLQDFTPKPMLHIAGKNDPLVKYSWQEVTIDRMIQLNDCDKTPTRDADAGWSVYRSSKAPVFTYVHDGTHKYPETAPAMIARFFKTEPWKATRPANDAATRP
jgi:polyhydroxybutyrate depolymerase